MNARVARAMDDTQRIKQQLDELLALRQEKTSFVQEKDNMLMTIAILVYRLGGKVVIGIPERDFMMDWLAGKIVLDAEQSVALSATIFSVRRMSDVQIQDTADADEGPGASAPGPSATQP
jgi:hypothetical protein